jgi:hypothetical protein
MLTPIAGNDVLGHARDQQQDQKHHAADVLLAQFIQLPLMASQKMALASRSR